MSWPPVNIDEFHATIKKATALHVFTAEYPIPPNALHDAASIALKLKELQVE